METLANVVGTQAFGLPLTHCCPYSPIKNIHRHGVYSFIVIRLLKPPYSLSWPTLVDLKSISIETGQIWHLYKSKKRCFYCCQMSKWVKYRPLSRNAYTVYAYTVILVSHYICLQVCYQSRLLMTSVKVEHLKLRASPMPPSTSGLWSWNWHFRFFFKWTLV